MTTDILEEDVETVDEVMGDEDFVDSEDEDGEDRFLGEEFDPEDDEDDTKTAGAFSYGWGYNDAFDKPEDVDHDNHFDEDEEYALGKKSSPGEDSTDDDDEY